MCQSPLSALEVKEVFRLRYKYGDLRLQVQSEIPFLSRMIAESKIKPMQGTMKGAPHCSFIFVSSYARQLDSERGRKRTGHYLRTSEVRGVFLCLPEDDPPLVRTAASQERHTCILRKDEESFETPPPSRAIYPLLLRIDFADRDGSGGKRRRRLGKVAHAGDRGNRLRHLSISKNTPPPATAVSAFALSSDVCRRRRPSRRDGHL